MYEIITKCFPRCNAFERCSQFVSSFCLVVKSQSELVRVTRKTSRHRHIPNCTATNHVSYWAYRLLRCYVRDSRRWVLAQTEILLAVRTRVVVISFHYKNQQPSPKTQLSVVMLSMDLRSPRLLGKACCEAYANSFVTTDCIIAMTYCEEPQEKQLYCKSILQLMLRPGPKGQTYC